MSEGDKGLGVGTRQLGHLLTKKVPGPRKYRSTELETPRLSWLCPHPVPGFVSSEWFHSLLRAGDQSGEADRPRLLLAARRTALKDEQGFGNGLRVQPGKR